METTPDGQTTLVAGAVTLPPIDTQQDVQAKAISPRHTTRRKAQTDLYNKIGYTIALIMGLGFALLMWFIGARYTVLGLQLFGFKTTSTGWYILPLGITAVELWLMPKRGNHLLSVFFFLLILAFDVLTSWYGLRLDLAGRNLPLGTGWQLPSNGTPFHIACVVLSLGFAFLPEKLGKWAGREMMGVWL